jgi:Lysyl oxidase
MRPAAACVPACGLALLIAFTAAGPARPAPAATGAEAAAKRPADPNICLKPGVVRERRLRCPDLRMRPPFALDRAMVGNTPVLRAANSIDSVGVGPAELMGHRSGQYSMNAVQRIHQRGGGKVERRTKADLYFKIIPGQGRYWKFKDAAKFSLWQLDGQGDRVRRVEVGPKQIYCLRDLEHTHPGLPNSPNHRVYPACSQDPSRRKVVLGTSVGWSDVYPSTYHENWIELNDIPKSGCYAFAHTADPNNGIHELNEKNNQASTVVYLTRSGGYNPGRCQGVEDRALRPSQTADDTEVPTEDPKPPYKVAPQE